MLSVVFLRREPILTYIGSSTQLSCGGPWTAGSQATLYFSGSPPAVISLTASNLLVFPTIPSSLLFRRIMSTDSASVCVQTEITDIIIIADNKSMPTVRSLEAVRTLVRLILSTIFA